MSFTKEEIEKHYDKGMEIAEALIKIMPPSNNLALLIALGILIGNVAKLSPDDEVRRKVLGLSAAVADEVSKTMEVN